MTGGPGDEDMREWQGRVRALERPDASLQFCRPGSPSSEPWVFGGGPCHPCRYVFCGFIKLSPLDINNKGDKIIK